MRPLRRVILGLALSVTTVLCGTVVTAAEPASGAQLEVVPIAIHVREAARRFGIPERWIYAVIRAESGGRIAATSRAGAMGLMQIMPQTWQALRARYGLASYPYDPRDNIMGGAAYIREMYDQFGAPGFLGAYNAGPARYAQYLARGRVLPTETRAYIAKIAPALASGNAFDAMLAARSVPRQEPPHWTSAALFTAPIDRTQSAQDERVVVPSSAYSSRTNRSNNQPQAGLFVPLSAPQRP